MMRFKGKVSHKFAESPLLELRMPPWRSRLMALLILGSFVVLIGRAFYLQIVNTDFLQEKGESRYRRDIEITASRGRIADRHGDVLAISTPMKSIWAVPPAATLTAEQTRQLAELLETNVQQLARKLDGERPFVFLGRQIPPAVAERVAALKLPGIGQDKEYRRFYPTGEMTAHMVGFTGVDDKGLEGVELAFHGQLLGQPGSRSVIKDRRGQIVEDVGSIKPPQDGQDIRLALDSKIQYLAYSHLKQAIADNKAQAGGVVVLDARRGDILARGQLARIQPEQPREPDRQSATQSRGDRYLRARFDAQAVHHRAGDGERQGSFRHDHQLRPWTPVHWQGDDFRRSPARRLDRRAGDSEIVERRRGEDRRDAAVAEDVGNV